MEFDTKYLYTIVFFASMIGMIGFLGIMLGFIKLILKIYNGLVESIFGNEEIKEEL